MATAVLTGFFAGFSFVGFLAVVQAIVAATRPRHRRGVME